MNFHLDDIELDAPPPISTTTTKSIVSSSSLPSINFRLDDIDLDAPLQVDSPTSTPIASLSSLSVIPPTKTSRSASSFADWKAHRQQAPSEHALQLELSKARVALANSEKEKLALEQSKKELEAALATQSAVRMAQDEQNASEVAQLRGELFEKKTKLEEKAHEAKRLRRKNAILAVDTEMDSPTWTLSAMTSIAWVPALPKLKGIVFPPDIYNKADQYESIAQAPAREKDADGRLVFKAWQPPPFNGKFANSSSQFLT